MLLICIWWFLDSPHLFNTSSVGDKKVNDADLGSPNAKCDNPGPTSSMHRWGTLVLGCDISDDDWTAKEPPRDKTHGICYNKN
jgi:hypothetical protein